MLGNRLEIFGVCGIVDMASEESDAFLARRRKLEGKVAIITGGASGIGEATAKLFAACGAQIVVGDVQDELGEKLCKALDACVIYKHCNVSKEEDVSAMVDLAMSKFGKVDIMFSNAGILGKKMKESTEEMDMEDFMEVMKVNVVGTAHALKHAARVMVPLKQGCIICTASIASIMAGVSPHAYTASKHAILGLTKCAASDLGKHGIRVNCISPDAVLTPLLVNALRDLKDNPQLSAEEVDEMRIQHANLRGRKLSPLDIAKAALFLASDDDAGYISGHNLVVDGGFHVTTHVYD